MFRGDTDRIGLAGDGIRNIKTRADVIAGIDTTITT
jgi:hypothetical protein